jgi:hypothetical protein
MEFVRAFLPLIVFVAIMCVVMVGFFAWYFGFGWL